MVALVTFVGEGEERGNEEGEFGLGVVDLATLPGEPPVLCLWGGGHGKGGGVGRGAWGGERRGEGGMGRGEVWGGGKKAWVWGRIERRIERK